MTFLDPNREPSAAETRVFGLLLAAFFGLIGGLVWWSGGPPTAVALLWSIGAGLGLLYYAVPPLRRMMIRGWMRITFPLGWVLSHLVLALIYYLVFTPMALVLRALGRDPLQRRWEPAAESYWSERRRSAGASRYFKQS